jgi:hypothetical protein
MEMQAYMSPCPGIQLGVFLPNNFLIIDDF